MRHFPCTLTSCRLPTSRRLPCTLTIRRLPGFFRTNKMHANQPFGWEDPFGRTRCTLTSRRLPIGLNYLRLVCVISQVPFERTRCTPISRRLPCTLTSRRLPCTLTIHRLPGPFWTNKSFPAEAT
ncbi:hypothetical protein DPMN_049206 [Dreissena polymorpha]|uniref:Uncharacterized protein n=1 Tax=Dreissena polymorpha TaxID=45954 RepID=A0A9D4HN35_DREPO|nr:hypothetical protein DPMN_049206 [Dreissena polymorpha]